jgi:hypothetical protein
MYRSINTLMRNSVGMYVFTQQQANRAQYRGCEKVHSEPIHDRAVPQQRKRYVCFSNSASSQYDFLAGLVSNKQLGALYSVALRRLPKCATVRLTHPFHDPAHSLAGRNQFSGKSKSRHFVQRNAMPEVEPSSEREGNGKELRTGVRQ